MIRVLSIALSSLLLLGLWACDDEAASGGSGINQVSFAVSDYPVDNAEAVVITIEQITLNLPGDDVVIDSFPADDPDDPDVDSIQVDLLDYQGLDSKIVVDVMDLEVAEYQNMRLSIVSEDVSASYVQEIGGARKPIKVPSGELKLGRFEVIDGDPQVFVIEFNLFRSLTYNPGPDRYILKPTGVRIVDVEEAAVVAGFVNEDLFVGDPECEGKDEVAEGNVMYLYQGHGLDTDELGDAFDPDLDTDAAADYLAPYAVQAVADDGSYAIAYVPAGDYTLAFSCDAEDDDPDYHDGIDIPVPSTEITEISLSAGEGLECHFPLDEGACPAAP